jgi:exopolyphosphatase/guanosine-5'-triphosphate,3'-diphosphate pyrophosphatase
MQDGTLLAAVDLGSNSFRLEIGRLEHGQIQRIEYLKETVRQGAGLDGNHNLTPDAMQRGWDCLARFAERLAGFTRPQVRAVATQTLREAANRDVFIARANAILGFPIEVVPGLEEARLIYKGVARLLPQSDERRLVVDIGGRSTELILGRQFTPSAAASCRVGSVSWSARFFADGAFSASAFQAAEVAAQAVFEEALNQFPPGSWDVAYGSSGTVGAAAAALAPALGQAGVITQEGLDWLLAQLLQARSADRLRLEGLKDDRRAVIGGGLSILRAVFALLGIQTMTVAQGALRQGALYELIDREQPATDLRSASVRALMRRFAVDEPQAGRVAQLATALFLQAAPTGGERAARKLDWAARLHEIGRAIAHGDHQHHGAYILEHADIAGFALPELQRLALLVRAQRGKLRRLGDALDDPQLAWQLMCLRTALALCHARRAPDLDGLTLTLQGRRCTVRTRAGWAQAYPQSAWLLREEGNAWARTPWEYAAELG